MSDLLFSLGGTKRILFSFSLCCFPNWGGSLSSSLGLQVSCPCHHTQRCTRGCGKPTHHHYHTPKYFCPPPLRIRCVTGAAETCPASKAALVYDSKKTVGLFLRSRDLTICRCEISFPGSVEQRPLLAQAERQTTSKTRRSIRVYTASRKGGGLCSNSYRPSPRCFWSLVT